MTDLQQRPPQYHVEAFGHPQKPDLAGRFDELPDFTGYRTVFWRVTAPEKPAVPPRFPAEDMP